jgi:hypothetical protein
VGWIERMVSCWIEKALRQIFFTAHLTHEPGIKEKKKEKRKREWEKKNKKERKKRSKR